MADSSFERFFELIPDLLCIASSDGRIVRVNLAFERDLGWSLDDLAGRPFSTLVHPDDVAATQAEVARLAAGGAPTLGFENRYRGADGRYRAIQWTATRDAATGLLLAIGRDVADERQRQADLRSALERESLSVGALRESEGRLAEAQRLAKIGSWELHLKDHRLSWSTETYRIFELDPANVTASYEAFLDAVHPDDREAVNRAYTQSVAGKVPYEIAHRLLLGDGRIKYLHERGRTEYDVSGVPIRSIGTVQDVTEQTQAERKALAQERRFRALIEHSSDLIALLGVDGTLVYLSPAFETLLGHRAESWVGRSMFGLIWAEDVAATEGLFATSLRSPGEVVPWQLRLRHADGSPRWFEGTGTNYVADTNIGGIVINGRDITDRKRAEFALSENEGRLRQAVRVSNIGIFDHDHAGDEIYWSPRQREIHGWGPDEPVSLRQFIGLIHPEDAGRVGAAVQRAHDPAGDGMWDIEYRIVRRDGSVRWLSARSQTLFAGADTARHPARTVGAVIDITDRKAAEDDLLRLDAAIASSINGLAMSDLEGNLTYVNRAFLSLWGYSEPSQVIGRPVLSFWRSPLEASEVVAAIQARGSWSGEMVARHVDGALKTLQVNASRFNGTNGRPAGMLASFLDVTQRKRTEEALRIKDQAIATALNGIAIADADGRIIYANAAFLRLWGYASEGEVLGKTPLDLAESGTTRKMLEELRTRGTWQGELVARRKDGSSFDVLLSANVVLDASGHLVNLMGSFLDISEAKRLQTQLLQAQKMEAIGRLAGGVAHDFNNLLTVIKGYLELALVDLNAADPLHRDLSEVQRAADSAATLTEQLLAFSRKQVIAPQILSMNDVVQRLRPMLKRLIGEDVDLQTMVAAGLGLVRFDAGQSEQILMNLAVNARDAMPNGGKLTIETANVRLDEEYVKTHDGVQPGDYVMLAVSDTGTGMSDDIRSHVFEPFFTTKSSGSGTGLGLAMIYGAVSQNGGHIEVYSEVGHGSTFKIYLPLVRGQEAAPVRSAGALAHATGTETILLVEDEAQVRALAARVLARLGYQVRECRDGASALRSVQDGADIRLLVTDVVMPDMNGRVLAERIRELRPDIKVLFTSGYTANVIVHHGVLKEGVEFLQKPYSVESLARRVREVLDGPL